MLAGHRFRCVASSPSIHTAASLQDSRMVVKEKEIEQEKRKRETLCVAHDVDGIEGLPIGRCGWQSKSRRWQWKSSPVDVGDLPAQTCTHASESARVKKHNIWSLPVKLAELGTESVADRQQVDRHGAESLPREAFEKAALGEAARVEATKAKTERKTRREVG